MIQPPEVVLDVYTNSINATGKLHSVSHSLSSLCRGPSASSASACDKVTPLAGFLSVRSAARTLANLAATARASVTIRRCAFPLAAPAARPVVELLVVKICARTCIKVRRS